MQYKATFNSFTRKAEQRCTETITKIYALPTG